MFQGSETISYYSPSNICVWMAMAFQAGVLNIGGFLACHRFVSHVTGFATFIGYETSQFNFGSAMGMLAVPLCFLFGAMVSGQLVDFRIRRQTKPKYYIVFGVIFVLVLAILVGGLYGVFGEFGEPLSLVRNYVLLALLCFTCGLQNGTVTIVSKAVIRTTHLTGITTDLGLGIIRVFHRNELAGSIADEMRANFMRAGIILFFVFGSIAGGFAFRYFQYGGFAVPVAVSGMLFALSFYFQVLRRLGS